MTEQACLPNQLIEPVTRVPQDESNTGIHLNIWCFQIKQHQIKQTNFFYFCWIIILMLELVTELKQQLARSQEEVKVCKV